jgi:hypothetical protein
MAAPIVSHIAAMVRSYYPNLSATDVKQILMQSVWKPEDIKKTYPVPQKQEEKTLQEIAAAPGIVNASNALQLAQNYKPGKKTKSKSK